MEYTKRGYLNSDFRLFHLKDTNREDFEYHYHDFDKIIIFISGKADYLIEGKAYRLQPYDIILVNQGDIHKPFVEKGAPYERIIAYLSRNFMDSYATDTYDLGRCFRYAREHHSNVLRIQSHGRNPLLPSITNLEHSFSDQGYANELYRQILFLEFMIQLNRALGQKSLEYLDTAPTNPKIAEILEYISAHLSDSLSIDLLSKTFYLSRYHLMRQFKEITGYTIGNYITYKRLLYAKELLRTGRPITQICYDCGFRDYSTFSRAYKKTFGETARKSLTDIH